MRVLLTLLLTSLLCTCGLAQTYTDPGPDVDLQFRVWPNGDEVRLFWWPTSSDRWARYRWEGFVVERRERNGGNWRAMTQVPVKEIGAAEVAELVPEGRKRDLTMEFLFNPDGSRRDYRINRTTPESALSTLDRQRSGYNVLNMAVDLDYAASLSFGLAYIDRTAQPGVVYDYRVRPAEFTDESSDEQWVVGGDERALTALTALSAEELTDAIELSWPHISHRYTAYDVYRREEGGTKWVEMSNGGIPVWGEDKRAPVTFTDSVDRNGVYYEYAVVGRNELGIYAPKSNFVRAAGREPVYLPTPLIEADDTPAGIRVSWTFAGDSLVDNISHFTIYRALTQDGGASFLAGPLPATQREYIDTVFQDFQYYNVRAYHASGAYVESIRQSAIADDSIPPPPVTGLAAVADREGRVTLTWEPSMADDAIGYRVFFSNERATPGSRLTDSLEFVPLFMDSLDLRTLGDSVYYRVVALDERENVSRFSEPYALPVPDINPPAPPRLRTVSADTNGVYLVWAPSSSDDVVGYQWRRRALGTKIWEDFATSEPTTEVSTFQDLTARDDIRYEYQLVALDEVDLRGYSNILTGKRLIRMVRQPVADLTGVPLPAENRVELLWNYPNESGIRAFRILRAAPGGVLKTYRLIDADEVDRRLGRRVAQWRFSDEDPRRDSDYVYAVQVEFRNGAKSLLGERIKVEY